MNRREPLTREQAAAECEAAWKALEAGNVCLQALVQEPTLYPNMLRIVSELAARYGAALIEFVEVTG